MSAAAQAVITHHALNRTREGLRSDPAYQGYLLLRIGFAVAPIVFGIDKFFNILVNWEQYLAPWIDGICRDHPSGDSRAFRKAHELAVAAAPVQQVHISSLEDEFREGGQALFCRCDVTWASGSSSSP